MRVAVTKGPAYGMALDMPLRIPSARKKGIAVMPRKVVVRTALIEQMASTPPTYPPTDP